MKKLLSIVLILSVLLAFPTASPISATALTVPEGATEVTDQNVTYKVIRTGEELAAISGIAGNYLLDADIDLQGAELSAPIAILKNAVLDGNGHCIKNYSMKATTDIGLFAIEGDAATTVKNLTVGAPEQRIQVTVTEASKNAGVLVGLATAAFTIENVHTYGDIRGPQITAAGIVGKADATAAVCIKNCSFEGSITGEGTGDSQIGGIIGRVENGVGTVTVEECVNYADLSSTVKVGGIGSQIRCGIVRITNCVNYGNLSSSGNNDGGILGEYYLSGVGETDFSMSGCVNYGNVSGKKQVGGLLGYLNTNAKALGGIVLFSGCRNYGEVNGSGANVGGIIGGANAKNDITVENCANFGNLSGGSKNRAGILGCLTAIGEGKTLTIKHSMNTGNMISSSRSAGALGEVNSGEASKIVVESFVNLGSLTGNTNVGGVLAEAKDGTTLTNCISAAPIAAWQTDSNPGFLIGKNGDKAQGSGNRYLSVSGNAKATMTEGMESALADFAAVLQILNTEYHELWGSFILNNAGNGLVQATPKLSGIQETDVENGKFGVRIIASLRDSLRYAELGFRVSVNGGEAQTLKCHTVHAKLFQTGIGGEKETVTVGSLGGNYAYALPLDDLAGEGIVTLTITPYTVDMTNATEYTGQTYTVTYLNGSYQGVALTAQE